MKNLQLITKYGAKPDPVQKDRHCVRIWKCEWALSLVQSSLMSGIGSVLGKAGFLSVCARHYFSHTRGHSFLHT